MHKKTSFDKTDVVQLPAAKRSPAGRRRSWSCRCHSCACHQDFSRQGSYGPSRWSDGESKS